jgi:hypothetical protein
MNISSASSSQHYAYIQPTQQRYNSTAGEAKESRGAEMSEPKAAQKSEPGEGGNMISLYA